jgi:hypothetical protein
MAHVLKNRSLRLVPRPHQSRDTWRQTRDTWRQTRDTWRQTRDTWRQTRDPWRQSRDILIRCQILFHNDSKKLIPDFFDIFSLQ